MDKWYIYCLILENNHFFINRATNKTLPKLIRKHTKGTGGWFTNKHKVIAHEILQELPRSTPLTDVDKTVNEYVLSYMETYGTDNVRGGGYSQQTPKWPTDPLIWIR